MHIWAFSTLLLAAYASANPFPQQTPSPTLPPSSDVSSTTESTSLITTAPGLTCTGGSTVLYTEECTYRYPISYCHSPEPPISCGPSSFPSVWHPVRCFTASTCYPVDADFITSECSFGGIPYSTSTLYQGTLAGGESTTITNVQCRCATDQWYSLTQLPGSRNAQAFCMPTSSCPAGMTTSTRTNEYCATASCDSNIPLTTDFCQCGTGSTAVYTDGPASATAVACSAV
jgi:hypothetical protein